MPKVAVLPGDGIGPEVIGAALAVLREVAPDLSLEECRIGGCAYDAEGDPFPPSTQAALVEADAALLGTVGGAPDSPWNRLPRPQRPESGLLRLREHLGVFANLRPVQVMPGLEHLSPLRPEIAAGVDLLIVRELLGGAYFDPRRERGEEAAFNTIGYTRAEIERVGEHAFRAAQERRGAVTSVDKANVLEVSELWRDTVTAQARAFPGVTLNHEYVDSVATLLVTQPERYDVLLTENLFGDILSDLAAVLPGSLGLMPSASLGAGTGLYEPIHGSAPDIAGQGVANPCGTILSAAMLLRYSLGRSAEADRVEAAVRTALREQPTRDLGGTASTQELTAAVLRAL
ncbi:3-isopropylmalate dehydrogenase [Deinococcus piscis]|uniref:3-isopropylmalate dehydrogenase n=1 Tax=Deinococcus piscis TaxID=394230 RepID=A0ABQ3KBN6_9DEIO|nr:3-isopropylmalate dehydrogenase [Deinococcus piscis]GHG07523.1 3-isopropylmalate dehydrogenase [Deinococcus piscis]